MKPKNLPYLGAIALYLKDSFPNSKIDVWIDVWSEESVFMNGHIAILARVDDAFAYTRVDPELVVNERHISDILVAKIKEVWNNG